MNALIRLESYIPGLRRYAWALARNADDADDLVQDCLERAIERLSTFRAEGEVRAWLFSILHNRFISDRRRATRRPTVELEVAAQAGAPELEVSSGQEDSLMLRDLAAALDTLPVDQRSVLLLVGVENLSYEEAARVLDVPVGTVMSRLSRARERLRLTLGRPQPERLRVIK